MYIVLIEAPWELPLMFLWKEGEPVRMECVDVRDRRLIERRGQGRQEDDRHDGAARAAELEPSPTRIDGGGGGPERPAAASPSSASATR